MPRTIFISAGEPSGDLHGASFCNALRDMEPAVHCLGFGGARMHAAGCKLLYPLANHAVIGLYQVLRQIHVFRALLNQAAQHFEKDRPDALVLIDYPGFHWWLAREAKARGIPVYYFVPPQIWAWASWRVRKMRRLVDGVFCNLPFETDWYRARSIAAEYVGHPYFDELARQELDPNFLAAQRQQAGTLVGILPGSRDQEIRMNSQMLLDAAAKIHWRRPDVRFLAACFKEEHRRRLEELAQNQGLHFITAHIGKTPEIIELAHSCMAVSGSVGLELLYRETPSLVLYRVHWFHRPLIKLLKKSPHISLVNLLADERLFPEFLTSRDASTDMARQILRWLEDEPTYSLVRQKLREMREEFCVPGASQRAAKLLLHHLGKMNGHSRAA